MGKRHLTYLSANAAPHLSLPPSPTRPNLHGPRKSRTLRRGAVPRLRWDTLIRRSTSSLYHYHQTIYTERNYQCHGQNLPRRHEKYLSTSVEIVRHLSGIRMRDIILKVVASLETVHRRSGAETPSQDYVCVLWLIRIGRLSEHDCYSDLAPLSY